MYKILINIITKTGNVWTFYQKDGADYVGKDLNDIKEVALELLDKYGRSNIKIINQRCGDDTENVIEYLYSEDMGGRNYEELENLPWINNVELIGKLSLDDLGIDQDFVKDNDYVHTDNNYSTEEKEKLSSLENYDDAEIRDLINSKQPAGDYALRSDIPDVSNFITKTVADLVNYYNKNETYTQAEVKALIEAVKTIDMEIVPAKPEEPKSNIIYLIPNGKAGNNIYDEYVYVNNKWELIGSTDIDLSNYYNKAEIDSKINIELSEEEKYTDMQTFANNLIGDFTASLNEKQNIIPDLEDIRDGALKGSTALQSVPSEYITETELNNYHDSTKVDKQEGKGLSSNDFTDEEKEKLSRLENYDDTQVKQNINLINEKIPTQATNNNKLADKDFVNSSLNSITAFYITKNANGDQFNNKAELDSAIEFYSGGEVRVPTRNDYCIVLEDETKDNSTTRYIYQNEQWEFQYIVNETPLTSEQIKAINSGITPELVAKLQGIDLTDVQINGESIVTDGVANLPCGIPFKYSMAKFSNNVYGNWVYSGIILDSSGSVKLPNVSDEQIINSMDGSYQIVPVLSRNIRTSVKTAMCDGKGDEWTEDEKLKAQERIGVSKIPSGMTLTADVVLEESVERVNFNEIIVKNYEKLIIYVFRPATTFSSGYGNVSFSSNVGGGLGGTEYNAYSTNQKINVRHTLVKTDGTNFEATSEWVNAGNNINDTAFIKSAYKPDVNPYSGYLVINTTQTFPVGTHILIYTK